MLIASVYARAFLYCVSRSRRWIEAQLEYNLKAANFVFTPTFSGRVALVTLAREMRKDARGKFAAYPDYVCNIIPRALEMAGWQTVAYRTDHSLEPAEDEIDSLIERTEVGLLVTASIFGSSALLDYLDTPEKKDMINGSKLRVIVDICQNSGLTEALPSGYSDQLAAVISFNEKATPGLMGGGILWTRKMRKGQRRLSLAQRTGLFGRSLLRLAFYAVSALLPSTNPMPYKGAGVRREVRWMLAARQRRPMDYSYCASFPNEFNNYEPSKLQLAFALSGLLAAPQIEASRTSPKRDEIVSTRFAETAPFVILSSECGDTDSPLRKHRQKPTYAIENSPSESLRPELIVVHNKGYCDK